MLPVFKMKSLGEHVSRIERSVADTLIITLGGVVLASKEALDIVIAVAAGRTSKKFNTDLNTKGSMFILSNDHS